MSVQNRRKLLLGAMTSLGLASLPARVLAQSFEGFDDDRLYQDSAGQLYRRRGGQYVPYNGRVSNGRPVPDSQTDLDAEAYARRRAERYGEPPAAEAPNQTPRQQQAGYPVPPQEPDNGPIDYTRAYAAIANEPFPVQA
ncbi:MAG: L,D-transpeptidase, partial [Methylobacteriaceae bacterium]